MNLLDVIRADFDLRVRGLAPGGRGALGEIWRLHLDGAPDLAVKLVTTEVAESVVALEVSHTETLARHGIRVPAAILNRHGHYTSQAPTGRLRLYEWIDGSHPDGSDPFTPPRLGALLGAMHAHARPVTHELDGRNLSSWYHHPPQFSLLAARIAAAEEADPSWAGRLSAMLPTLQDLTDITKPPTSMLLCHRDLHPDNVLSTSDGQFAVLDWDNLGPADPSQELASVLLHWFADRTGAQHHLIKPFLEAYHAAGGPGRLTGIGDFAMHLSTSLNFLALQLEKAADPSTGPDDLRRAAAEIEESLRFMPTHQVLADISREL